MTPLHFAVVGLRLLGIYCMIQAGPLFSACFLLIGYVAKMNSDPATHLPPGEGAVFLSALIPGGVQVLIGVLLLIYSAPLARRLVPAVADESGKTACSFEDVQAIAFAAVGILILADALPQVGRALQNLCYWYNYQQQDNSTAGANQVRESLMYAIGTFAQVIIGLVLLLNPRGFRNAWHWLRTAGTRPAA